MSAAADRLGGAPRVSVIVPTFNRAKMVCSCVASVLAAEDSNLLEVIVIDDCSPDDTKARVAAQFGGDARVRYFRNARNSFQAVSPRRLRAMARQKSAIAASRSPRSRLGRRRRLPPRNCR